MGPTGSVLKHAAKHSEHFLEIFIFWFLMTYYMVILKNHEKIALRWTCPKNTFKVKKCGKPLTISLSATSVKIWQRIMLLFYVTRPVNFIDTLFNFARMLR